LVQQIPSRDALLELTKDAVAIYTDDDQFALPAGWRRVLVTEFSRNWVIYMKSQEVKLFRIETENPAVSRPASCIERQMVAFSDWNSEKAEDGCLRKLEIVIAQRDRRG